MLRLDLRDGTNLGITTHDVDLDFDLGDGSITYSASTGALPSDVSLAAGLDADNFEVEGPLGELITFEAVMGGRFDRARARLFDVNWKSLGSGAIKLLAGNVAEPRVVGGRFIFEVRSDADFFNQTVGATITNMCRGDHALCCVNIAPEITTTVTAVANAHEFTVAATLTDNHIPGRLWFTSGALDGTLPVEIYTRSGNTVTLFTDLVAAPEIGDELIVKEGCDRTRTMCRDRFNNVLEFRGFPEVPGSDQVLRSALEGQGNE